MVATFDYVAVVSDLHLGPEPQMSLFHQEECLAEWIAAVGARPETRVGLVLGGDIVDFLASPDARPFNPDGASSLLGQVVGHYPRIFESLKTYLAQPGRFLVIVAGNHDAELALVPVYEALVAFLAPTAAARGQVVSVLAGEGYRAQVGGRIIYCTHGNEADSWNMVDHEAVRRINTAALRGQPAEPWAGNPGGNLVTEVLNPVKRGDPAKTRRARPFVDLLMPAGAHFVSLLPALDPELQGLIKNIWPVFRRIPEAWAQQGRWLSGHGLGGWTGDLDAALEQALKDVRDGVSPRQRLAEPGYLSSAAWIARKRGRDPFDALRRSWAKDWHPRRHAPIWDPTYLADDDQKIIEFSGGRVDFLVAGHTHAARCISNQILGRRCHYFNSGTWIDLIRIEAEHLADAERFQPVKQVLEAETQEQLRQSPLVRARPTAVEFYEENSRVVGRLLQVDRAAQTSVLGRLEA